MSPGSPRLRLMYSYPVCHRELHTLGQIQIQIQTQTQIWLLSLMWVFIPRLSRRTPYVDPIFHAPNLWCPSQCEAYIPNLTFDAPSHSHSHTKLDLNLNPIGARWANSQVFTGNPRKTQVSDFYAKSPSSITTNNKSPIHHHTIPWKQIPAAESW